MPAKASGKVKTRTVHHKQKNGDIYVLKRQTLYDPEQKTTRVLNTKLIGKIPKGSETVVPTRPKRKNSGGSVDSDLHSPAGVCGIINAYRVRTGMMDIIDHAGRESGIDAAVYQNTDSGTAQKILSLARYLLATNGQTLPGILTWQFRHPLPYEDGITEGIYHDLFVRVGLDESLQQNYFAARCAGLEDGAVLAYDSSTISAYSENQAEARYGFNKADDGLKTVKVLTLYSIDTRQPVVFTKQPGNIPDVVTVENALKQMSALGIRHAEVITDNGYYSEDNISSLCRAHFDFITLAKCSLKWVGEQIEAHAGEFRSLSSACPYDPKTHGITIMQMREFKKTRKYANRKSGAQKGDVEAFSRRIYLHIYYNAARRAEEDERFDADILELKGLVENGIRMSELTDSAQVKAGKYLHIHQHGSKTTVAFNDEACEKAKQRHGYFALISSREKDTFRCLAKYRRREVIEDYFEAGKQKADGARIRVQEMDTLRGRMFVQFVALCYHEYFIEKIHEIKSSLSERIGSKDVSEADRKQMKRLKIWLENTPLYLILQWFDTVEEVTVSSKLKSKRWATEITKRDRLFLTMLGMDDS